MSEMDAPTKMEQFWDDNTGSSRGHLEHHGINLAVAANHDVGGSTESSGSGHSSQYERFVLFYEYR